MKLPKTWGWFGFSMVILSIVLFAFWGLAQIFNWIFPWHGKKIFFVIFFVLFPIGVALFSSSEAWDSFTGKDEED